jgi:hypothetical protein
MSDGEFIVKFIAEKASADINPVEAAKEEISEIDIKLHEADALKLRRIKLIDVLDHFGDDSYRRRKKSSSIKESEDIEDTSKTFNDIKEKIKEAIKDGPMVIRDLIQKIGTYDQDILIMRAVKSLGEDEIVSRDSEGRLQKGKNY